MGAGGKRPITPIVCYDMGVRMGLRPAEEWAEILQVHRKVIYEKKNNGQRLMKRYTFAAASPEEVKRWREAHNLSEMAKTAAEQGKSYGQLVAERWMEEQQKKKEEPKEMEAKEVMDAVGTVSDVMGKPLPELAVEPAPKTKKLHFADFVDLIDGHVVLDLYTHRDGEDVWLMSIPSDSPLMEADVVEGTVEFFCIPEGQENAMRVYIK